MTRSWPGRTRSKSPTTTTSAKAFTSIWRESKQPPVVLPKPARISNDVTNAAFSDVKHRLERNLAERENTATNPGTAGISTNAPGFLTNKVVAPTNAATVASKTNLAPTPSLLVLSNGVPALTNPPPFVPAMAPVLTNIPPVPPPAPRCRFLEKFCKFNFCPGGFVLK